MAAKKDADASVEVALSEDEQRSAREADASVTVEAVPSEDEQRSAREQELLDQLAPNSRAIVLRALAQKAAAAELAAKQVKGENNG